MTISNTFCGDIVFAVRPSNEGVLHNFTGEWGDLGEISLQAECACGLYEYGTASEIGELLRGHILWHRRLLREPNQQPR